MKVYLLIALWLAGTTAGSSQSQFWLKNYNTSADVAPVFNEFGQPLEGTNFLAELWGGTDPNSLAPALGAYRPERVFVPFEFPGIFIDRNPDRGGYSTFFDVVPGQPAWLQVRAWDSCLGSTYEAVAALGLGGYGASPIFSAIGTDPFAATPQLPGNLTGLQSFSLLPVVPEPSTWALLVGGTLTGWWAMRRRRL